MTGPIDYVIYQKPSADPQAIKRQLEKLDPDIKIDIYYSNSLRQDIITGLSSKDTVQRIFGPVAFNRMLELERISLNIPDPLKNSIDNIIIEPRLYATQ